MRKAPFSRVKRMVGQSESSQPQVQAKEPSSSKLFVADITMASSLRKLSMAIV